MECRRIASKPNKIQEGQPIVTSAGQGGGETYLFYVQGQEKGSLPATPPGFSLPLCI